MTTKAQMAKSRRKPKFSTRIVRRCELTGRAHGVYRKFRISRIMLRKLALEGKIPGNEKGELVSWFWRRGRPRRERLRSARQATRTQG